MLEALGISTPLLIGGVVVIVVLVGLVAVGFANRSEVDPLQSRLEEYISASEDPTSLEQIELSVGFSQRVILPILQKLAGLIQSFTPQEALEKTQHQIDLAGSPPGLNPSLFWTIRIVATLGLGGLLGFVFTVTGNMPPVRAILFTLGGALAGFILPIMWLRSKITTRQGEIIKALPDALDLMTICVEAGLGFDAAMTKVAEKWDNELAIAYSRVIQEIQVGKTRKDALRSMSDRMDVPDVTAFVGSIIQADQLGVSISKVLRIQADTMRMKRRQRAEEKAQQAPVKMVIPMVFLIFPTIYLVLLGPAALQTAAQFGMFGG